MKTQSIHFFDPQNYSYHLPDETAKNLNMLQRASSILIEKFNELKRMNLVSKAKIVSLQGTTILSITAGSCFSISKLLVNDDQEGKEINWFTVYVISMIMASTILCGNASRKLIQCYSYSTCLFSQDSQFYDNKITPYIWKSFLELKLQNSDLIDLWCSIKSLNNEVDTQEYLRNKLEHGVCFGYVMAILDQLEECQNLHGDELLKNIDMNTVIKKQLLQHFYFTFHNLLHSQDEVISEIDDCVIVMRNTDEIILLSDGRNVRRSDIKKASKEFYKLMLLIKGNFKINIFKSDVIISEGVQAIKNHFLEEIKRLSFLELEQLDPDKPLKSIYHCLKVEDFLEEKENLDSKSISKQTELNQEIALNPSNNTISILHFITDFALRRLKAQQNQQAFIHSHLVPYPQDTIIAGHISLKKTNNKDHPTHALYFRLSNRKYHLFDPNEAFYELPNFQLFFEKLYDVVTHNYGSNTKICFTAFSILQ